MRRMFSGQLCLGNSITLSIGSGEATVNKLKSRSGQGQVKKVNFPFEQFSTKRYLSDAVCAQESVGAFYIAMRRLKHAQICN